MHQARRANKQQSAPMGLILLSGLIAFLESKPSNTNSNSRLGIPPALLLRKLISKQIPIKSCTFVWLFDGLDFMTGFTQYYRGINGLLHKDITFLREVKLSRAKQIHQRLEKMRKDGISISNWWYYPDTLRFNIEWNKPMFR